MTWNYYGWAPCTNELVLPAENLWSSWILCRNEMAGVTSVKMWHRRFTVRHFFHPRRGPQALTDYFLPLLKRTEAVCRVLLLSLGQKQSVGSLADSWKGLKLFAANFVLLLGRWQKLIATHFASRCCSLDGSCLVYVRLVGQKRFVVSFCCSLDKNCWVDFSVRSGRSY